MLALETNCGPAVARNVGMDAAWDILQPSAVMFTDLDCLPDTRWTKCALERLETLAKGPSGEVEALLGGMAVSAGQTVFDAFHERWGTLSPRLIPAAYADAGASDTCLYAPSCNLAVAGSRLLARGGIRFDPCFRTSSFEDVAFCLKARVHLQAPVLLERRMKVVHVFGYEESILAAASNLRKVCKQFAKYGSWQPLVDKKYPFYESWLAVSLAAAEVPISLPAPEVTASMRSPKVATSAPTFKEAVSYPAPQEEASVPAAEAAVTLPAPLPKADLPDPEAALATSASELAVGFAAPMKAWKRPGLKAAARLPALKVASDSSAPKLAVRLPALKPAAKVQALKTPVRLPASKVAVTLPVTLPAP